MVKDSLFSGFHIVICPAPTMFPDGLSEKQVELLVAWWKTHPQSILSTEHHKSGTIHYDGIIQTAKPTRSSSIERSLFSILGVQARSISSLEPAIRKHMIDVAPIYELSGAINYCMMEGHGDLVMNGYKPTWIQEQIAIAVKNKAKKDAEKKIFVNDSTFFKHVRAYQIDNDMENKSLQKTMYAMLRNGYTFVRVKAMRTHIAEWAAIVEDNEMKFNAWFSQFEPQGY